MIDRERLKCVIGKLGLIGQNNAQKLFTWSGLEDESVDLGIFYITGFGLFNLPFKQNDFGKLSKKFAPKGQAKQKLSGEACCQIDASQLTFLPNVEEKKAQKNVQDVTYSTLQKMLDINFENLSYDVQPKLEKLIICDENESYKSCFNPLSEPGKFGTLLLKIPLKTIKPAGKVIIYDGTKETRVALGSNTCYVVTAIAGKSSISGKQASFSIVSDPGEVTAVMVFHLIWTDYVTFCKNDTLSPLCFPEVLIATHEIKAALTSWEITEATTPIQQNERKEVVSFLCLPIAGNNKESISFSDLSAADKMVFRCLKSITFLDVCCARIEQSRAGTRNWEDDSDDTLYMLYTPVRFHQIHTATRSLHGIAQAVFESTIDEAKNLIDCFPEFTKDVYTLYVPAIVIWPRNINHIPTHKVVDEEEKMFKPELFMKSLASRMDECAEKNVLENPFVFKSLLKELGQLIEYLNQQSPEDSVAVCPKCFSSSLFFTCFQLKAEDLAQKILKRLPKYENFKQMLFVCQCTHEPYGRNPVVTFSRFICFTRGWENYPDVMRQLTHQMLSEGNYGIVCEVALNLTENDNMNGARETFHIIMEAVKSKLLKPEELGKLIPGGLVPIAMRLHQERPSHEVNDFLLSELKHLEPHQSTELIESLGKSLKDQNFDCKFLLKEIGNSIRRTDFRNFTPQQFLKVVGIFKSVDEQLARWSWKSICSQCIAISNQKETKTCLFCGVLREEKSTEVRKEMVADLSHVKHVKEAVRCSLEKLSRHPDQFNAANCIEYVNWILLVEKSAQLSKAQIIENISALFSELSSSMLESLLHTFSSGKYPLISDRMPIMKDIYRSLLERIADQDLDALLDMDVENIVAFSALFGALDVVKLVVGKLDTAIANAKATDSTKVSALFHALSSKINGCDVASSLNFSRDIFNYLALECIKSLQHVTNVTSRASCCVKMFQLLATSERSFADSKTALITDEWSALTQRLTLLETVTIVKETFENEMTHEGPSLKKFQSSWSAFKTLCSGLLLKLETTRNCPEETDGFTEQCFVTLTQCLLWIGDEKAIGDFFTYLNDVQRSNKEFADVHQTIIRNQRTEDLASSSMEAAFAFNDLIDRRMQVLIEKLNTLVKVDSISLRCSPSESADDSSNLEPAEPARKFRKVATIRLSSSRNTDWQKEIDELQALRKRILRECMLSQSKTPLKC